MSQKPKSNHINFCWSGLVKVPYYSQKLLRDLTFAAFTILFEICEIKIRENLDITAQNGGIL